ncbi:hypothetical protein BGZ81_011459 [Podila clonocystis]|nr:hypothetical protein BGZ81_011459 [Podila clonocystis]
MEPQVVPTVAETQVARQSPKHPEVPSAPQQKEKESRTSPPQQPSVPPPVPQKKQQQQPPPTPTPKPNEPPQEKPTSAPQSPTDSDFESTLMTGYPPPPPLILYSDDNITVSSLHLTIHAFYFPLNTPVTIPLLSITEVDTQLPEESGGYSGGAMSWLKYKNWGVPSISDIWWARDQSRQAPASVLANAVAEAKAAMMAGTASSPSSTGTNTPKAKDVLQVIVRVEGEWLRKGFGVQNERGVTVLKEAWKTVKESELGIRSLRPAVPPLSQDTDGFEEDEDDFEGFQIESKEQVGKEPLQGAGAEKRRWLNYHQNTWTAYPYADDSPQFLSQQRRGNAGSVSGAGGVKARLDPHHYARLQHRKQQEQLTGPAESCGDDPLFIDNDLNIHEGI